MIRINYLFFILPGEVGDEGVDVRAQLIAHHHHQPTQHYVVVVSYQVASKQGLLQKFRPMVICRVLSTKRYLITLSIYAICIPAYFVRTTQLSPHSGHISGNRFCIMSFNVMALQ